MNYGEELLSRLEEANLWEETKTLDRGAYLKKAGTTDLNLYFVLEGSLRVYVVEQEEEHTIRFGYQFNIIASLDSFISEQPSDMYIQALKKSTVKRLSKERYMDFMQANPKNQFLWSKMLEMLIFQQIERERDLLISSPKERYLRVLNRSPKLFQEIPNKYIANYLRMTPETLSRIHSSTLH